MTDSKKIISCLWHHGREQQSRAPTQRLDSWHHWLQQSNKSCTKRQNQMEADIKNIRFQQGWAKVFSVHEQL